MKKFYLTAWFTCAVLLFGRLCLAQTYVNSGMSFETMTRAKSEWIDWNNDDYLDLFVVGTDHSSHYRVLIYTSTNGTSFSSMDIASLRDVAYAFADYNQDGYIDLLLAGKNTAGSVVLDVYENNGGTAFVAAGMGMTGFSLGGVVWTDVDHDGDPDIVASGQDVSGAPHTWTYVLENGNYTEVANDFESLSYGQLAAFDANNDGITEVLLSGYDADGNPTTVIYSIKDDWSTSVYTDLLPGWAQNAIAVGDYNQDGYADLAISGISSGLSRAAHLYTNNRVNGFSQVSTFMDQLSESAIHFADLNNDGLLDLTLTGLDENEASYFYTYINSATHTFTQQSNSLKVIYSGDAAIGDFDRDGDADIFQIGNSNVSYQANLYVSDLSETVVNTDPVSPGNLMLTTSEDTVFMSWDAASDDLTSTVSLSYNAYISQSPGGVDVWMSPMSDVSTGYRQLMRAGNAGYLTSTVVHGLPEGNYYAGVQSIDNGSYGSPFTEEAFTVCYGFSLGSDTAICAEESITFSIGSGSDVVNWYSLVQGTQVAADVFTYEHMVTERDTIVAEWTKAAYGCTVYDTLVVDRIDLPEFTLGNDTLVCYLQYLELSVADQAIPALDSANWYSLQQGELLRNGFSLSYLVSERDTLVAEVFNESGCVYYDTLIVDVLELPTFDIGHDTSICYGETLPLSVSDLGIVGLDSANWYSVISGQLLANSMTLDYTVLDTDTLVAEVFNTNGCVNYDTLVVDVYALPDFNLGNDTSICYAESLELSVTDLGIAGRDSVNWYSRLQGELIQDSETLIYQVFQKDTLIAEVFNVNGCVNYDTLVVDVFALPDFSLGNDTTICYSSYLLLSIQDPTFTTINWYSKNTGGVLLADSWFFNYQVLETDTLIAEVYNTNGCVNYDTIAVHMDLLPDFNLEDQSVCYGDSLTLSIPGNWTEVNWYTFGNQVLQPDNSVYKFRVEETVTLWAEVYNAAGCVNYDTITVTMLDLPEFELGADRTYCYGDPVRFDLSDVGTDYEWTDAGGVELSTAADWSFMATESQQLFLTITNANGCSYSDSISVTVNPLPVFTISGEEAVCAGDTTALRIAFGAYDGINWYNEATDSLYTGGLEFGYAPETSGYLYAALTDENACQNTDSLFVTVNSRPEALAGADTLICYGQQVTLGGAYTDAGSLTFSWSPADALSAGNVPQPEADPLVTTLYVVEVTDANGCNSFDSVTVSVNEQISIDAGADVSICYGYSATLGGAPTANGGIFDFDYTWSPATGLSNATSSNPLAFPDSTTTYYLQVTSGYCQLEYDTVTVTVHYAPEISVIEDQSVGVDASVTLWATGGETYTWTPVTSLDDPSSDSPVAAPLETTEYEVTVTDENGCVSLGYVTVYVQNILFIPNLFTPNDDGANDFFLVYGSGIATIDFQVYDLHGTRLYRTTDVTEATSAGWDGSYRGQPMPPGNYVWSISGSYADGNELIFNGSKKGMIKLVR